jgi:hypothetical protein
VTEEEVKHGGAYKPGLQAQFIIDKMSQEERSIQEALSKLTT